MSSLLHYLALGDSYTVGETLPLPQSFPYQAMQLLRAKGWPLAAPEIVAKTGWTTDELWTATANYHFLPSYDLVTLLIGVNNQYRGRSAANYAEELEPLVRLALERSGHRPRRVALVSIPDYGVTPAGQELDAARIARELDELNALARKAAERHGLRFIGITEESRAALTDASLVAQDRLHPSAAEYRKWAVLVAEWMEEVLQEDQGEEQEDLKGKS